jgi:hypothetical protein
MRLAFNEEKAGERIAFTNVKERSAANTCRNDRQNVNRNTGIIAIDRATIINFLTPYRSIRYPIGIIRQICTMPRRKIRDPQLPGLNPMMLVAYMIQKGDATLTKKVITILINAIAQRGLVIHRRLSPTLL